jgi:hypothetical protein
MQALNFCRQVRQQIQSGQGSLVLSEGLSDFLESAVKFQMPVGGRIINDMTFRSLDPHGEIRLPFDSVAIEYLRVETQADRRRFGAGVSHMRCPKSIAVARHIRFEEGEFIGDFIGIIPINWFDEWQRWECMPPVYVPAVNWGVPLEKSTAIKILKPDSNPIPLDDYSDEVGAVVDLVAALACANVKAEIQPARKPRKKAGNVLPFDSYRFLTVDVPGRAHGVGPAVGDRRSPREHIRRGHIRRLSDGRAIWINAAIVNAGIGSRVDKSYRLRAG